MFDSLCCRFYFECVSSVSICTPFDSLVLFFFSDFLVSAGRDFIFSSQKRTGWDLFPWGGREREEGRELCSPPFDRKKFSWGGKKEGRVFSLPRKAVF